MPLESTLNELADLGARASIGRYKKPPGEMHEFEDNWRQVGPLASDYEWTGWTEVMIIEEDANMEKATPFTSGAPPPKSASTEGVAKEMSGEVEDDDLQANKAPMLDHEDKTLSEVR